MKLLSILAFVAATAIAINGHAAKRSDMVRIDGSSTVYPITEAVAEKFNENRPDIRVTVAVSGTGGGFKKFTNRETDISNASRRIKSKEIKMAKKNDVKFVELPVAYDGITVVVNKRNTWANSLTTAELRKIWMPGSTVKLWSDVRADFPKKPIKLYGPGTDSGTFDYFTKAINGKSHVSRSDFTMSENDNVLVKGVLSDKYAMAYFGYAYYVENKSKLKAVAIDNGNGAVAPTLKTINNGSYAPLSRPVFIYVSKKSGKKPQVFNFVNFYLENAGDLVSEVGYVPLTKIGYKTARSKFQNFVR